MYLLTGGTLTVGGNVNIGLGTLTVGNSGKLSVTGNISQGGTLTENGGSISAAALDGNFTQNGGNATFGQITGSNQLTISGGQTTLALSGGISQFSHLTVSGTGTLDVTNNVVEINYGVNKPSPISAIESNLASGYNGGAWNGAGIISSTMAGLNASQSALVYAVGCADGADGIVAGLSSGQIEIMPTLAGDCTLQGAVNFGDFQILVANFGKSGGWGQGNFIYGSVIDFGDFQLLADNFGADSSGLTSGEIASLGQFASQFGDTLVGNPDGVGFQLVSVPEPASAAILVGAVGALLFRRSNQRKL